MKNGDDQAQTEANRTVYVESPNDDGVRNIPVYEEREHFTDCAGAIRYFDLTIYDIPGAGFSGQANEVTSATDGGYMLRSFAEASFTTALARLRGKIRAGLAQRFLIHDGEALDMPLERLCGRIDCDGVVVDGRLLDWAALQSLLQTYEGWEFELRIPFEDRVNQ